MFRHVARHTLAGVAELHAQVLSRLKLAGELRLSRQQLMNVDAQRDTPGGPFEGLRSIDAEVHHDLMQLPRVGQNRRQPVGDLHIDLQHPRQRATQELQGFLQNRPRLDDLPVLLLLPGERQNLPHKIAPPRTSLVHVREN